MDKSSISRLLLAKLRGRRTSCSSRLLALEGHARYLCAMTLPFPPAEDYVESPCVAVCTLDQTTKICIGCLRTVKEIGAWRTMTIDEKRAVVAACKERALIQPARGRDWKPLSG